MALKARTPEADEEGGAIVDEPDMSMEDHSRCMRKYLGGEYRAQEIRDSLSRSRLRDREIDESPMDLLIRPSKNPNAEAR